MTEDERDAEMLKNLKRRDELQRDIPILEQKLGEIGGHMARLARALSENPGDVRVSARANTFELLGGESVMLDFKGVARAVAELQEARDELVSVNAALEPRFG